MTEIVLKIKDSSPEKLEEFLKILKEYFKDVLVEVVEEKKGKKLLKG